MFEIEKALSTIAFELFFEPTLIRRGLSVFYNKWGILLDSSNTTEARVANKSSSEIRGTKLENYIIVY